MSGFVFASIAERTRALVILDEDRRTYAGLSRDGTYWHLIGPSQVDVANPDTGEVLRRVGDLVCTCRGGTYHGHCYRIDQAVAFEKRPADEAAGPVWLQRPVAAETELEKAAARG